MYLEEINYSKFRSYLNNINRFDNFMENEVVVLGWMNIDDISAITSKDKLSELISSKYPQKNNCVLGLTVELFMRLLNMKLF